MNTFYIYNLSYMDHCFQATEDSRELCKNVSDIAALKVTDADIDNISLSNLGFEYDGKGNRLTFLLLQCLL